LQGTVLCWLQHLGRANPARAGLRRALGARLALLGDRSKSRGRKQAAVPRERASARFCVDWKLMNQTELYVASHQEKARRG